MSQVSKHTLQGPVHAQGFHMGVIWAHFFWGKHQNKRIFMHERIRRVVESIGTVGAPLDLAACQSAAYSYRPFHIQKLQDISMISQSADSELSFCHLQSRRLMREAAGHVGKLGFETWDLL